MLPTLGLLAVRWQGAVGVGLWPTAVRLRGIRTRAWLKSSPTALTFVQGALLVAVWRRWLIGKTAVLRELSMQAGRHSSLAGIRTAAEPREVRRLYAETVALGWRVASTRSPAAFAYHADSGCLAGDFASNASAKRLGRTSRCSNDRRYLAHQCAQSQGRADAASSSHFELLDLFVRGPVYLVELAPSVVDQLCDFIKHAGHRLVEVRLIHHRDGVPHVHAMHSVNHLAGVVRIETVCCFADACGAVCIRVTLLAQSVCDV